MKQAEIERLQAELAEAVAARTELTELLEVQAARVLNLQRHIEDLPGKARPDDEALTDRIVRTVAEVGEVGPTRLGELLALDEANSVTRRVLKAGPIASRTRAEFKVGSRISPDYLETTHWPTTRNGSRAGSPQWGPEGGRGIYPSRLHLHVRPSVALWSVAGVSNALRVEHVEPPMISGRA